MRKRATYVLLDDDGDIHIERVGSGFDEKKRDYSHDETPVYYTRTDADNARRYMSEIHGQDFSVAEVTIATKQGKKR
jgi:hypothetical protein